MPIFLSEESENIKARAEQISYRLGHFYMGCEHVFMSCLDSESWLADILSQEGTDSDTVRQDIVEMCGAGDEEPLWKGIITSPRLKRILKLAEKEAEEQKAFRVYPNHIISAVCREGKSVPARVLTDNGVDLISIRRRLLQFDYKSQKSVDSPQPSKDSFQYPAPGTPYSAFMASRKKEEQDGKGEKGKKKDDKKDKKIPTLAKMGRDLVELAKSGKVDPIVGRKDEIRRVLQTLTKKMKNNPIIIGEAGVGKTAVVYGLAERIASGRVPDAVKDKRIIEVGMSSIIAGTKHRGEFEERMEKIIKELMDNPDIILFIDEIHTIMGVGSKTGVNAGNMLKPHLARGDITIIGATTTDEYRKTIETDPALERRFQPVFVEEPSEEETIEILQGLKEKYEKHHSVTFTPKAVIQAVKMSVRYIPDRNLPDKAIDLMDEAAAKSTMKFVSMGDEEALENARQQAIDVKNEVTEEDIAEVVSLWTGVPATTLTQDETERLLQMEEALTKRVVGQDEAVKIISETVRMNRMGLSSPNRPSGVFLFLGPTGVGKTEMAKALAEFLFNSEKELIRLDMSEYMEKHAISRMIGSPPGYVGHDEEGQLTKQVRTKPYSVVLLDEVEKAHPEIFDLFLQVYDDGRLTDSKGRTVNFTNTTIIMTSNIGTGSILDECEIEVIDTSDPRIRELMMNELKEHFRPEFLNRIDEIIIFNSLNREALTNIVNINLDQLTKQLRDQREVQMQVDQSAKEFLINKGYDPAYGARPMKRAIQNYLAKPLAKEMLAQGIQMGDTVLVSSDGEKLVFRAGDEYYEPGDNGISEDTIYPEEDEHRTFGEMPALKEAPPEPRKQGKFHKEQKTEEPPTERNLQQPEIRKPEKKSHLKPPQGGIKGSIKSPGEMKKAKQARKGLSRISFAPLNKKPDMAKKKKTDYPVPKEPILKQRNRNQDIKGIMPMKGPLMSPGKGQPGIINDTDFEETKPRYPKS